MNPIQPGGRGAPFQVAEEKYSASMAVEPPGTRVSFRGTISTVNPATVLNPFVDAVHEDLLRRGAKEVRIDFRDLEFCNSSGFKSFIYWIQKIQATPEPQRYGLRFLSNPARKWQRTSLLALSCYGVNCVVIE
ncbi:MAG TPA: hypothetical protein VML50_16855 [Anaeromyxobacter sp.]|nr:hypothetical protein [Anaeromyxobacter sp.]